jgi:hypothetical protein
LFVQEFQIEKECFLNTKNVLSKFGTIGVGHFISFMTNNWFDYLIYVPVIAYLGPFVGCGIMIILSVILNLSLIWIYDKTGKDWLGYELIKQGKSSSKLPKWVKKMISMGDVAALIGLSLYDPFHATIYLRKQESTFKGLSARDWKIFLFSTFLANIGWTTLVYFGVKVFNWLL